jgi:hypothetical protein
MTDEEVEWRVIQPDGANLQGGVIFKHRSEKVMVFDFSFLHAGF